MTITRKAKYLSANDFGKPVSIQGKESAVTGVLVGIDARADYAVDRRNLTESRRVIGHTEISLIIVLETGCIDVPVKPNTRIIIEGTPTPPGLNLHQPVTEQQN